MVLEDVQGGACGLERGVLRSVGEVHHERDVPAIDVYEARVGESEMTTYSTPGPMRSSHRSRAHTTKCSCFGFSSVFCLLGRRYNAGRPSLSYPKMIILPVSAYGHIASVASGTDATCVLTSGSQWSSVIMSYTPYSLRQMSVSSSRLIVLFADDHFTARQYLKSCQRGVLTSTTSRPGRTCVSNPTSDGNVNKSIGKK